MSIKVTVDGFKHASKDELHGYWDTQFVDAALAKKPLARISQLAGLDPATSRQQRRRSK